MPMLETLHTYLEAIRQMLGAEAGTLFIPSPIGSDLSPFLCQAGAESMIPEMQDMQSATAFVCEQARNDAATSDEVIEIMRSSTESVSILSVRIDLLLQQLEVGDRLSPEVDRRCQEHTWASAEGARLWLGLYWEADQSLPMQSGQFDLIISPDGQSPIGELKRLLSSSAHLVWAFHRCAAWQQDPLSRMPGRAELQGLLGQLFRQAREQARPLGLLMINPDDFATVNQRLGRQRGDGVLAEVAERIGGALRQSDMAFRYGGAVFAVLLPGAGVEAAKAVADKLRHALKQSPYAQKAVRLAFSMGMAIYDPERPEQAADDANELLHWADNAINQAKLAGGGRTVVWDPQGDATVVGSLDRLSGIFTADTEKDYRNMLLLWETVAFIASNSEGDAIAREFITRIGDLFKPFRAVLLTDDEKQTRVLAEFVDERAKVWMTCLEQGNPLPLSEAQTQLFERVSQRQQVERLSLDVTIKAAAQKPLTAYAIPMLASGSYQGCLYVEMQNEARLDSSDIVFLSALANQVANALAHAFLATRWKENKEQESSQLKQEVRGLRQALQHSKMVFCSAQMHQVMETMLKVAPTDATVLVTGESGTGKEMLAKSLHEMSLRKDQPFVTVDCGAISPTLLESELFGRVKGAYTGADSAAAGRILQADGGTLFLDEVGELPLDVQAKLLRFVQEKEMTPVGASKSRQVDVRIVAATNRNLAEEVRLGRYRQDLYYRLQVFVVEALPLRLRPDDILPLARYFLEKFSVQYQKGPLQLGADAEAALLSYPWPGNVRELQNVILKVVVMCASDNVNAQDLNLPRDDLQNPLPPLAAVPSASVIASAPLTPAPAENHASQAPPQAVEADLSGDPWEILSRELQGQVQRVLSRGKAASEPLGRWLGEDLVLLADETHRGIARRASSLLGMAETTFRRQVQKVRQEQETGRLTRVPEWRPMGPVLNHLLSSLDANAEQNVSERVRGALLQEVISCLPDEDKTATALMGVTLPTYRRWKESARV